MSLVEGRGCWPGKASGHVVWIDASPSLETGQVADRSAEVNRFRIAQASALAALEHWAEWQTTVEGRLLIQSYHEALANTTWSRRAVSLIDREGLAAPAAAQRAAEALAPILARSPDHAEQGRYLVIAAEGLSEWLDPRRFADDVVVAAEKLSTIAILALGRPVLLVSMEAPSGIGPGPVVWGVPGLNPAWNGSWVSVDGCQVQQRMPDAWILYHDRLNEIPLWRVDNNPGGGSPHVGSAALIVQLDDLAAVPLLVATVGAVAVDLDALGHTTWVDHPGTRLLLAAAAQATHAAGIPYLAGGSKADRWSELGFTGRYHLDSSMEGSGADAL